MKSSDTTVPPSRRSNGLAVRPALVVPEAHVPGLRRPVAVDDGELREHLQQRVECLGLVAAPPVPIANSDDRS